MKPILLFIAILFTAKYSFSQTDSINGYFIGINKGEKYKIVYKGNKLIEKKCNSQNCMLAFSLPKTDFKEEDLINLHVYRKGKCGWAYRNTELYIRYKSGFKYLMIYRNDRLKNRYAIESKWTNERVLVE